MVRIGGKQKLMSGGYAKTTNNRMELIAAIKGLETIPGSIREVDLYSDSRYVTEAMIQGWAEGWKSKRWMKTTKKPVPNADLWKLLLEAANRREVTWHWVKGHAGHPENERVNDAAQKMAETNPTTIDAGYLADDESSWQLDLFGSGEHTSMPQGGGVVEKAGDPCRKCGTPVVRKIPKRKLKPGQSYYYEYYYVCPACGTMYLTEKAKRSIDLNSSEK